MAKMNLNATQQRRMALGVMNWINRQAPQRLSWDDMTLTFDDWCRYSENHDTVAAMFWANASENQIKILEREYKKAAIKWAG